MELNASVPRYDDEFEANSAEYRRLVQEATKKKQQEIAQGLNSE